MNTVTMVRPTLSNRVRIDSEGNGQFGTPRQGRPHNGTDYDVIPDDLVLSPMTGVLVRRGIVYRDRTDYTLCEIRGGRDSSVSVKLMYMRPFPSYIGKRVYPGDIIGYAQDVSKKQASYAGVTPHIHMEVRIDGQLVDPESLINT